MTATVEDWLAHNIHAIPKRGYTKGSTLWFDGDVLIKHSKPVARLLKCPDDKWLLLKDDGFWYWKLHHLASENGATEVNMNSIGASSMYGTDILRAASLHRHIRDQLNDKLRLAVVRAGQIPISNVVCHNGEAAWLEPRRLIREANKEYETYCNALQLGWMQPLINVDVQVNAIFRRRIEKYERDAPKRERKRARQQAMEALGLAA